MRQVDTFVLLDDAQYTRRDWRNRNRIRSATDSFWLTVPVNTKSRFNDRIEDIVVSSRDWSRRHWASIHEAYAGSPGYDDLALVLEPRLVDGISDRLSIINSELLMAIAQVIGIEARLAWSSDHPAKSSRGDRILDLCRAHGASHYLSGPSATYLDVDAFSEAGIEVAFADYALPEYQQHKRDRLLPWDPALSIIDTIANLGVARTAEYLQSNPVVSASARWPHV